MHKAVEHNTKYFRVEAMQTILLRRGSQLKPMLGKIAVCSLGLFYVMNMQASNYMDYRDQDYVVTFLIMMATYVILISSLYFIQYALGEMINKVPVRMAYILMRILVAYFLVFCHHLYVGIQIEVDQLDSGEDEDQKQHNV